MPVVELADFNAVRATVPRRLVEIKVGDVVTSTHVEPHPTIVLLLGNGASCAFSNTYAYSSLSEVAKSALPGGLQDLLDALGGDFEWAMEQVQAKIAGDELEAGVDALLATDEEQLTKYIGLLRTALVRAIRDTNASLNADFANAASLQAVTNKLDAAWAFLRQFRSVFTTNYDLLLYYALMRAYRRGELTGWRDGFTIRDALALRFTKFLGGHYKEVFYLHGGLHLFTEIVAPETHTKKWRRGGDAENPADQTSILARVELALEQGKFPLVVTEGTSAGKVALVAASPYLKLCHEVWKKLDGNVFVYGHSLSDRDAHIMEELAKNPKVLSVTATYRNSRQTIVDRLNGINTLRTASGLAAIPCFVVPAANVPLWA